MEKTTTTYQESVLATVSELTTKLETRQISRKDYDKVVGELKKELPSDKLDSTG